MEEIDLPLGYWLKSQDTKYICIGLQFGGHMGGECELFLPKDKLDKFCSNSTWRQDTVNRFSKIVFLAKQELNVPIPASERGKDGIVPDNW